MSSAQPIANTSPPPYTTIKASLTATADGGQSWHTEQMPAVQGATLQGVTSVSCPTATFSFAGAESASRQQLTLSNDNAPSTADPKAATRTVIDNKHGASHAGSTEGLSGGRCHYLLVRCADQVENDSSGRAWPVTTYRPNCERCRLS